MAKYLSGFLGVLLVAAVVIGGNCVYTVDETKQVVLTQFGEPIGGPITKAGLYFKLPVIQTANYFEKRILPWDGDPNQIPTLDKRYIWVDTMARWRIVDPLKFMQSMGNESAALGRLDDIVDSAARDAISNANLVEAIRDSNRLVEKYEQGGDKDEDIFLDVGETGLEKIKIGREELMKSIQKQASLIAPRYGIELIDVRIKRINYVQEVQKKVYERMISERKRAAEKYRSEGQGKKAEIEGQMTKELQDIRSQAYKAAQELMGEADAEAIKIYADAYNKDPGFYSFLKTMDTYKKTIDKDTTLILSTDNDFYQYLKSLEVEALP